jgi:hypothetical protein
MGLLDDAIREHLELKRQRGADPDEVTRQERAVLAPLHAEEEQQTTEPLLDGDEHALAEDRESPGTEDGAAPDPSNAIQETAEIDMRAVLESGDSEGGVAWAMPERRAWGASARLAHGQIADVDGGAALA